MKNYEFRKWNTYEEWYEVEANNELEAREKLSKLSEEDCISSDFAGQEGETELYRVTELGDEEDKKLDCGCSDVPDAEIVEKDGVRICIEHQSKYQVE